MENGALGRDNWPIMRSPRSVRSACLVALGVATAVACGSDDGNKQVPRRSPADAGEGGRAEAGGGSTNGVAGEPVSGGGHDGNGASGMATGSAGAPGASGADSSGGAAGAPGIECATGTANCDDDPTDCETNTATDASNCGRCARSCGGTAVCSAGLCAATEVLNPSGTSNYCGAAASASTLYAITCWGNSYSEVRSVALEPAASVLGTQIKLYSGASAVPLGALRGVLIDGNDVLYGLQESPSHIYKFPLNADGPEDVTVAYTFENQVRFDDLKLIGDTFYFNSNTHTAAGQIMPSTIKMRPKTGVSTTTLVSGLGLSYNLQVFATKLVWLEQRTAQSVLSVYRAPLAGAAVADVELLAVAAPGGYMTRQGDYVYWTHKAAAPNGKLRRLAVEDAAAEIEDVATGLNLPEGLITDEQYAYFKQLDALYRLPLAGGAAEQLSPAVPAHDTQATALYYIDAKYVYFSAGNEFGASNMVRVAK
jgi:hypothetical protein